MTSKPTPAERLAADLAELGLDLPPLTNLELVALGADAEFWGGDPPITPAELARLTGGQLVRAVKQLEEQVPPDAPMTLAAGLAAAAGDQGALEVVKRGRS